MPSCPRCVRPVAFDTARCPHCEYDIPPLVAPLAKNPFAEGSFAEPSPAEPSFAGPPFAVSPSVAPSEDPAPVAPPPAAAAGSVPVDSALTEVLPNAPLRAPAPLLAAPPDRVPPRERRGGAPAGVHRSVWLPVVAAVAVIVIVIAALLLFTGGSGHHSAATRSTSVPSTASSAATGASTERAQAAVIAGYLAQSGQMRSSITTAITTIEACGDTASAVTALQNAAATRTHIVSELETAKVDALPNGATLAADLAQAMTASAAADTHYAAWGQAEAGCAKPAPHNADFAAAQKSDTQADAAKATFVAAWNPVATTTGQATLTASGI